MKEITKEELIYIRENMTAVEGAKHLGVSIVTFYKLLRKAGVKVRDTGVKYKLVEVKG